MSELIAVLLITVGQLLGSGAAPAAIAAQLQADVVASAPMSIEELVIAVSPEQQAAGTTDVETWELRFDFENIFLEPVLVNELAITVHGLALADAGGVNINALSFRGKFTEEALTAALEAKKTTVHNPRVELQADGITLKGSYGTWLGRVPFEVKGNLSVENQTQLVFSIDKSKMIGIPIPGVVNRIVQSEINPVYDLDAFVERSKEDIKRAREMLDYEFYLEVEKITPADGFIIVTGSA